MEEQALQDLVETLQIMAEVEKTVGEFYRNCAGLFEHDSDFWLRLAEDEGLHAEALTKLSQMVFRKPGEYQPGRLPSVAALRTFISRVQSDQERLSSGTLTMDNALLVAYLMEMTVIECNYTEVVRTTNPKCLEALRNLSSATVKHKGRVKEKMENHKKRGRRSKDVMAGSD
jgi:hypothetical protein